MSDVYSNHLPAAFPWAVEAPRHQIRLWVRALMSDQNNVDGSSFAVDVAVRPPNNRIWLSEASLKFLETHFSSATYLRRRERSPLWPEKEE